MSEIKMHAFFFLLLIFTCILFSWGVEAQHGVTLFSLLHQYSWSLNLQAAVEEGHSTFSVDTPDMKISGQVMTANML